MKNKKIRLLLSFVVIASLLFLLLNSDSEEKAVKKALAQIEELSQISEEENKLLSLAKTKKIIEHLGSPLTAGVDTPKPKLYVIENDKDLSKKISSIKLYLKTLEVKFQEIKVDVEKDEVQLIVNALGSMPGHHGKFFEKRLILLKYKISSKDKVKFNFAKELENLRG